MPFENCEIKTKTATSFLLFFSISNNSFVCFALLHFNRRRRCCCPSDNTRSLYVKIQNKVSNICIL